MNHTTINTQNHQFSAQMSQIWRKVREQRPLVQSLTNFITVNDCANVVLALGASPIMATYAMEFEQILQTAKAVVINIGQMDEALFKGARVLIDIAAKRQIPVIIDPVGAAASPARAKFALELIASAAQAVIKGNAAEILALINAAKGTATEYSSGLDCDYSLGAAHAQSAMEFAARYGCVIAASAEVDFICDASGCYEISGGSALSTQITGTGCMLAHAIAACAGVCEPMQAALAGCFAFKQAAEAAAAKLARASDVGGFKVEFFNELAALSTAATTTAATAATGEPTALKPSEKLRTNCLEYLPNYLNHPFLTHLANASLDKNKFKNYLVQDFLYLQDYARVFAIALAKAQTAAQKAHFERSCEYFAHQESLLHEFYLGHFELDVSKLAAHKRHIDNIAYTSYMIKTAYESDILDILAAVLACAISYEQIAAALANSKAASDEFYHHWLDEYLSSEYRECNERLCALYDECAQFASAERLKAAEEIFANCLNYELKFWELAYE